MKPALTKCGNAFQWYLYDMMVCRAAGTPYLSSIGIIVEDHSASRAAEAHHRLLFSVAPPWRRATMAKLYRRPHERASSAPQLAIAPHVSLSARAPRRGSQQACISGDFAESGIERLSDWHGRLVRAPCLRRMAACQFFDMNGEGPGGYVIRP